MSVEKTISSQQIYEGRVVGLRVDTVELPNGQTTKREIVEHGEVVAIVPIDENENVLMVRQYRKPVERFLLEIPAGGIDPGETPEEATIRELREETGYTAGRIERLGGFFSAPGFCTEYLHLFLATDLTPSPKEADVDEDIELVRVPLQKVQAMVASEEIHDAKTLAGLLMALCRPQRSS